MLELGLKVLISYLLGSMNGSLLLGRFKGIDIRNVGSGNAGGTNALRALGRAFAVCVMIIDIGKGFLAPWYLPDLALPGVPIDPAVSRQWLMLACAGATVFGHCYPVWFGFRGGKGAATSIGAMLAVAPAALIPAGIVWVLVLVLTGYVGLSTMLAAVIMPVWQFVDAGLTDRPLLLFLLSLAVFIVFTHRANIARMRRREENRMEKAMLLRRSR